MTSRQKMVRRYNQGYYRKNRQKLMQESRDYRRKNKDKIAVARRKKYELKKDEILEANALYRMQNVVPLREQKRAYRLRKMGLSELEINKALEALRGHAGVCTICGVLKPGGMGGWLIDHNHKTKKFRGILCNRCNTLIGFAEDSVKILLLAIKYIRVSA
jgi:hypothetical protein